MRRFFRFLMMALILIVVGVMSALTSMSIAIHGRETSVPSFTKMSVSEAQRLAVTNGLSVQLEGQFYSSEIPEGRIVSQVPAPGTRVRRGWKVRLAQSLGPQRVVIPDVLGQSPRAAELNVRQRGLELGTVAEVQLRDAPPQQIIAQSPPPNAQGILSPKVSVLVAAEPDPEAYVMPNFVGHPLSEAASRIEQAGFKIARVYSSVPPPVPAISGTNPPPSATAASGVTTIVLKQLPAAGQRVTIDSPIELEVSR
jgi:eukaryotic-like serine/threonine-protein kinase